MYKIYSQKIIHIRIWLTIFNEIHFTQKKDKKNIGTLDFAKYDKRTNKTDHAIN